MERGGWECSYGAPQDTVWVCGAAPCLSLPTCEMGASPRAVLCAVRADSSLPRALVLGWEGKWGYWERFGVASSPQLLPPCAPTERRCCPSSTRMPTTPATWWGTGTRGMASRTRQVRARRQRGPGTSTAGGAESEDLCPDWGAGSCRVGFWGAAPPPPSQPRALLPVHLWRFSGGYPALMECMNKLKQNKVPPGSG